MGRQISVGQKVVLWNGDHGWTRVVADKGVDLNNV
jgi:hypothetical protein